MQGKNIDLLAAVSYIKSAQKKINSLRSDTQFDVLIKKKEMFINSTVEDFDLIPLALIRTKKKKNHRRDIIR